MLPSSGNPVNIAMRLGAGGVLEHPPIANQSPTAVFTHSENGLTATFDASGSSDPDGTIQSFSWDFGDGNTGTGVNPSHTYAATGSYTVTLTVTDDSGATDSVQQSVSVVSSNATEYAGLTPTKYVTASADGTGIGTPAAPWTLQQAMLNAQPGDIVGIAPGQYVGTAQTNSSSAYRYTPAFYPRNANSATNKIILVGKYDPHVADAITRTEIRSGATTSGNGWPAFGTLGRDGVEWINIYSDETQTNNKTAQDSATAAFWTTTGSRMARCRLLGENVTYSDNHAGLRLENTSGFIAEDNYIANYALGGSGAVNQAGIQTYETSDAELRYNEIVNCGNAIHFKGRAQYRNRVYFNKLANSRSSVIRIHSFTVAPDGGRHKIYQNLAINCAGGVEFAHSSSVSNATSGIDIFNNTFVFDDASSAQGALLYITESGGDGGNTARNNIIYAPSAAAGMQSYTVASGAAFAAYIGTDYNLIFGASYWADGSSSSDYNNQTLSAWQTLTSQDAHSLTSNPQFTDRTNGDYTLATGSPALSAGVDYEQLLGGSATDPINLGCYISSAQDETIGIR